MISATGFKISFEEKQHRYLKIECNYGKKVHQKIEIAFNFMKEIHLNLFGAKQTKLTLKLGLKNTILTVKLGSIFEKSRHSSLILIINGATPRHVPNLAPIRKLFCTILHLCYSYLRPSL